MRQCEAWALAQGSGRVAAQLAASRPRAPGAHKTAGALEFHAAVLFPFCKAFGLIQRCPFGLPCAGNKGLLPHMARGGRLETSYFETSTVCTDNSNSILLLKSCEKCWAWGEKNADEFKNSRL